MFLKTFKTILVGPRAIILLLVDLNDLETSLELDYHADTSFLGGGVTYF